MSPIFKKKLTLTEKNFVYSSHLVGMTLQPYYAVPVWAMSLHVFRKLCLRLYPLKHGQCNTVITTHKEEAMPRTLNNAVHRVKSKTTPFFSIDPLASSNHPTGIVDSVNGVVSPDNVNVDCLLSNAAMKEFESGYPVSFRSTLKQNVTIMTSCTGNICQD